MAGPRDIDIQTIDGSFSGTFWAPPGKAPVPGVLLIQEIFGINSNIRAAGQWLAAQGFCVLAPDLFWRIAPQVQLDPTVPEQREKATALLRQFSLSSGLADCAAALQRLRAEPCCSGALGIIGYCLGGRLACLLASKDVADAVVAFYPVGVAEDLAASSFNTPRVPLLVHLGENDPLCPPEVQTALKARLQSVSNSTVYSYPNVGHAFARLGRSGEAAQAAELAERRTTEFLLGHLNAHRRR